MPFYIGAKCKNMDSEEFNLPVEQHFLTKKGQNIHPFNIRFSMWLCGSDLEDYESENVAKSRANICSLSQGINNLEKMYEYIKSNVLNEFFVIGLLERLVPTLELFEVLLPDYFAGAKSIYLRNHEDKMAMQTKNKTGISPEMRASLEQNQFKWDMDLYKFIERKFLVQYRTFVDETAN